MSASSAEWRFTDFEGSEFGELLQKLSGYIVKATGKEFTGSEQLRDAVQDAIQWYEIDRDIASGLYTNSLHDIEKPLAQVIEQLHSNRNQGFLLTALGDYDSETGYVAKGFADIENEYQILLAGLHKIARAIKPPDKHPVGRPSRNHLRMFVERLAEYWEHVTGINFKQYWQDLEPLTNETLFVKSVLEFVDPAAVPHLPKMTEAVVRDRRAAHKGVGEDPRLKTLGPDPFLHRKIYEPVKDR